MKYWQEENKTKLYKDPRTAWCGKYTCIAGELEQTILFYAPDTKTEHARS